jgi:putative phosphoribosyl transferase
LRARRLADRLDLTSPVVLALPREGVTVGFSVAARMAAPLDVFMARRSACPVNRSSVGAIAEGGEPVLDEPTLLRLGLDAFALEDTIEDERKGLDRRVRLDRSDRPLEDRAKGRPRRTSSPART